MKAPPPPETDTCKSLEDTPAAIIDIGLSTPIYNTFIWSGDTETDGTPTSYLNSFLQRSLSPVNGLTTVMFAV